MLHNDLPNCTDLLTVLYADDTTGLDSDSDLNTLMARASSELTKMAQWFQANKMSLNTSKTKYIIFHAPGKKVNSDIAPHIDENTPNTPHDPGRVTTVERIHSRHPTIIHKHLNYLASTLTNILTLTTTLNNSLTNSQRLTFS
jgi:hypothetical protein